MICCIQKIVNENEEIEYELRKSVKEAEFQRRKKEQEVQKLKEDLIRKKREDAKRIHEAIARSEQEEKELERHINKEKAKLLKVKHSKILLSKENQISAFVCFLFISVTNTTRRKLFPIDPTTSNETRTKIPFENSRT